MTVKHILEDSKGNQITVSVDYNMRENFVEKVNYVVAQKGIMAVDITEIFIEQMNGDDIIDKLDWADISNGQGLDPIDYDDIETYSFGAYEDSLNPDR